MITINKIKLYRELYQKGLEFKIVPHWETTSDWSFYADILDNNKQAWFYGLDNNGKEWNYTENIRGQGSTMEMALSSLCVKISGRKVHLFNGTTFVVGDVSDAVSDSTVTKLDQDDLVFDFELAFNKFVNLLPKDKQQHVLISKGLFGLVDVGNELSNPVVISLAALLLVLKIGFEKELKDIGLDINNNPINIIVPSLIGDDLKEFHEKLKNLEVFITHNKLDTNDLLADALGIYAAVLLYTAGETKIKKENI